ncbi:Oxidoreductase, N-terminal protein [Actinidia chinensis var. chinensis]|uniref:Oxidoreductase, N-terminal protein n=1 Tax=Actinidia chinensis var. chinensis TaxID=1590841 RepID=A0A2R6Q0T7_ACTCC|nr:Oxidoreductase, N-terminal protein [Actinidia chinensis var. chinensis]
MAKTTVRFGILGCANIARKMCRAISLSPNSVLYAIGSRSFDKASRFMLENGFSPETKVYGSYEEVLDDTNVDAVYVPLPTTLHVRWAVLAAGKRKHVLLEKPAALNLLELDTILEVCESNGVQFMDATMWMHHPRTAEMRALLSDGQRFGQLKTIHSCFTYKADDDFLYNNIRVKPDLDGLGALGDIGWYCIQAILWAADYDLPQTVTSWHEPELNQAGVILSCGSSLYWKDGRIATFYCSFLTNLTMDLSVLGTKGNLHIHDFAVPFRENVASYYYASQFRVPIMNEHNVVNDRPQEALMVGEFASLVLEIEVNGSKPEKKWPEISRKTQKVLDAVRASIEKGFQAVQIVS